VNRFRYLNGIDWVVAGLDRSLRQTSGFGNWSQVVLELDGSLDAKRFAAAVQRYTSSFPVLQGRAVRGWQLVPVWKMPRRMRPESVPIESRPLPEEASFEQITEELARCVTAPPGTPGRYIGFTLLSSEKKTWLTFRFDHRLLDARGAELFLHGLIQHVEEGRTAPPTRFDVPPQKPCLPPWIPKFKSGQQVVRLLHRQRHQAAPFEISPLPEASPELHFSILSLTQEQSDELKADAHEKAGYLMLTPWLASCMTGALDRLFKENNRAPSGYMIPCSADLRTDPNHQIFFNHAAFICLHRPVGEGCRAGWAQTFSAQFVEQVKLEIPRHFENAWKLSRILPASLYGRLLRGPLKSFGGTLSMASVGDGLSAIESIDASPVLNAFHMPMVPPAPGLGFFVNTFQGRLNICLMFVRA